MSKRIEFNKDARKKIVDGVNKLSNAVVATLGPFGRNVIIEKNGELPLSTKDGVTVAKSILLEDPIENIGSEIVKQAAINTAREAGDGTTTTTLLATSLITEGLSKIDNGANATEVKRQIDKAITEVVNELKNMSQNISEEQYKQVATIASNNDEKTGEIISTALQKVGRDGIVSIEESKTGDTYLETVEGMQFDRGYLSPYFVTNNNTMQGILENPSVLIYDGIISTHKDIMPLLEVISTKNESLLIIAEDVVGEALALLIVNKARGALKVIAVKAPEFGERRTLVMEDIAVLTGGKVVSKNKGISLANMTEDCLGKAGRVTVSKEKTTIIDGKGDINNIVTRAQELKDQLDKSTSMFETEKLQDRLAKLTSGVSIVYVGGKNDIEIKEYKDRVEDALFATKAAVEEGILPGGGVALFHAREVLKDNKNIGAQIVYKALLKPFLQILENAGIEEPKQLALTLSIQPSKWTGYDLKAENFVDFKEAGIIDPTKVLRVALQNAASVAGTILTTEAVIFMVKTQNEQNKSENYEDGYI